MRSPTTCTRFAGHQLDGKSIDGANFGKGRSVPSVGWRRNDGEEGEDGASLNRDEERLQFDYGTARLTGFEGERFPIQKRE